MLELGIIILLVISFILLILVIKKSNEIKNLHSTYKEQSTILDAINMPIFYKDKNGKFVNCNKNFNIAFGDFRQKAIDNLEEFRNTCIKEIDLVYDNGIKKTVVVNFANYLDGSVGILFDISKMKSDKTSIAKTKENLELALQGSSDGYWEWDVTTNKLKLSKKAKEILGYTAEDQEPEDITAWMNLVESYDIAKTNEALSSHIRGDIEFIDVEHRLKTSSKNTWVNFRGKGVYNANKEIAKVYGTIRDISKHKIELMKIKQEKDLFTKFMDNLPALSFIKDKQGNYIYINKFYQKLIGFKPWKNKNASEIFNKNISSNIDESDREAFYEGKYKHEELITNEEGIEKLFETYKFPIDSGKYKLLCGFGLDITLEKIYQEEVELFSKLFDNTNEAILITDSKGLITDINSAYQNLTGYELSEVVGENPNIRKSGKHNKQFYENMWKEILTKGSWSGEIFNKNKDGTISPELMNISTIKNNKGVTTNFIGIFQSIKYQKLIEAKLRKLAHHDALTNLPNRTLFLDRLDKAIQRASRDKSMIGLFFVDLDDFKIINDTLGHHAGDTVLNTVAKRLIQVVRESDTVARLGGDEFVIILEKVIQLSDISHIAEKLIVEIQKPIKLKENKECIVGASIGISTYPDQTTDKNKLIEFADTAMYKAKKTGKNCYKVYNH